MIMNQPLPLPLSPSLFFILGLVLVRKHEVKNKRSKACVFFYIKFRFKAWLLLFTALSLIPITLFGPLVRHNCWLLMLSWVRFVPVELQSCEGALQLNLLKIHHTVGFFW